MKRYTINVHYTMIHTTEVEAESEEEAIRLAEEQYADEDGSCDDFDGISDSCVTEVRDIGDNK